MPKNTIEPAHSSGGGGGAKPKEDSAVQNIAYDKEGFGAPVRWKREVSFGIICALIFGSIFYYYDDKLTVFANASLIVLFVVLLILLARFFGLGRLLAGMLRRIWGVLGKIWGHFA